MMNQQGPQSERGAIAITVAVLLTVVIGLGAVAVDLGQVYAERAQLQNGADAAALAIAQECYKENACTNASSTDWQSWAQSLANGNANDDATTIRSVVFSGSDPSYQVTVTTSTLDGATNAGFLTPLFAKALNVSPPTVGAQATASLHLPGSSTAFPIAISDCQFDLSTAKVTGTIQLITYKPGNTGCTSVSGSAIPGGFGWLNQSPAGSCLAPTDASGVVGTDTGANYPNNTACNATLTAWESSINAGQPVYGTFPVYDNAGGTGKNGWFHILGYATFQILGWKFSGSGDPQVYHNQAPWVSAANSCTGNCLGIIGQFIKYTSLATGASDSSPGADLYSVEVSLTK